MIQFLNFSLINFWYYFCVIWMHSDYNCLIFRDCLSWGWFLFISWDMWWYHWNMRMQWWIWWGQLSKYVWIIHRFPMSFFSPFMIEISLNVVAHTTWTVKFFLNFMLLTLTLSETQYDWRKIEPVTMKANFIHF